MFRLPQKVYGNQLGVGVLVCDDQYLGGARKHVDADPPVKLTLGFGNILVAGAYENVGGVSGELAECHGRNSLHAT